MTANNEIGVIRPIAEIAGNMSRKWHSFPHRCCTGDRQNSPRCAGDEYWFNVLDSPQNLRAKRHWCGYVRRHKPRVQLAPQMHGGGHERGMRSGTLYTPQIVGFAKAVELGIAEMEAETARVVSLRERLWGNLAELGDIAINGHATKRLPGNLNVSVGGVDGQALLLGLQSAAAVSSGSACTSAKISPSHVLAAIGRSDKLAYASIRFGIGRFNTAAEIDAVAQHAIATIHISPTSSKSNELDHSAVETASCQTKSASAD